MFSSSKGKGKGKGKDPFMLGKGKGKDPFMLGKGKGKGKDPFMSGKGKGKDPFMSGKGKDNGKGKGKDKGKIRAHSWDISGAGLFYDGKTSVQLLPEDEAWIPPMAGGIQASSSGSSCIDAHDTQGCTFAEHFLLWRVLQRSRSGTWENPCSTISWVRVEIHTNP